MAPYEATLRQLEQEFTVAYLEPRGAAGAPDLPDGADLHLEAFVSDLESFRMLLGVESFALAGHSHSGLIALHYALRHPGRVSRLVLLSPQLIGIPSHPEEPGADAGDDTPPEIVAAQAYLEAVGGLEAIFSLQSDAEATAFLGRILPLYFRDPAKAAPVAKALQSTTLPLRTLQEVSRTDDDYPLHPEALSALTIPTLVVSGRCDRFCPPGSARTLAGILPRGRQVIFEESGHFPWLEEPTAFFREAMAFLVAIGSGVDVFAKGDS
jgi:pimeloyl-ACP methyl ester carboxylesterase